MTRYPYLMLWIEPSLEVFMRTTLQITAASVPTFCSGYQTIFK